MGQSTRSRSAGVPTVRNLQQTQSISRDAGAGAQGRFVSGKAQPQKCQSTLRTDQAEGYDGGYCHLTAFIRSWRGEQGKSLRGFVPLTFALGEAFQFDWSEEGLLIGGLFRRIQVSHMKLCASRAFWLVAYPSQGHEMLFDGQSIGGGIGVSVNVYVREPGSTSLRPHLPCDGWQRNVLHLSPVQSHARMPVDLSGSLMETSLRRRDQPLLISTDTGKRKR